MKRPVALATATAMILLGVAALGGEAGAVVPGANGRIVFARETCKPTCMYTIVAADANDANETLLAGPYPRDAYDDHFIANWAPDGKSVIFMANQGIWQVNADGTGLHVLFQASAEVGMDDGPAFTPDGKHIVFTRCCPEGFGYSLWMIECRRHRPEGPHDRASHDGRRRRAGRHAAAGLTRREAHRVQSLLPGSAMRGRHSQHQRQSSSSVDRQLALRSDPPQLVA